MSSAPPHRQQHRRDLDLEEDHHVVASLPPPQPSSTWLNVDVEAAEIASSNVVDVSPFATTMSTNPTTSSSISTPPMMMAGISGLETVELNDDDGGPRSYPTALPPAEASLSREIGGDDNNNSKSSSASLLAAATCKKLKGIKNYEFYDGDTRMQQQSDISSEGCHSAIDPTTAQVVETDHEARFVVTSRHHAGENDQDDIVVVMQRNADNLAGTANTALDYNDADLHSLPEVTAENNIDLDTIPRSIIHEPQAVIIHNAFLVEELDDSYHGDVIIATHLEPTLPWWKQKRIQLILCALFLFGTILVIAVALLYSGDGNHEASMDAAAPFPSPSATLSSSTSYQPPVTSHLLNPKACADKVSANAQKIMIGLDNPRHPSIAVDESNMILAVWDGDTTSSQVVIFYSLMKGRTWHAVSSFRMENVGSVRASVALSGHTAFVGFGDANYFVGVVLVFEQNQLGSWDQVNDPFIRNTPVDETRYGFGLHHVAIDGDLACIVDQNDCVLGSAMNNCNHNVNTFRRINERWVEFAVIAGENCRIANNTLAVLSFAAFSDDTWNLQLYEFNKDAGAFVLYQDPIIVYDEVLSMELRMNYFVYWDRFQQGAVIYHRQNESRPFSFVDQIFVNPPFENEIALHNDVLIVGGDNKTHIFSEDNGNWAEVITLDQLYGIYEFYQVSGRTLIATTEMSVYSFNIEDCTQEMLTQSSSSSITPSSFLPPSQEPLSSSPPSVTPPMSLSSPLSSYMLSSSLSPTTCEYMMESNSQRIETSLEVPRFLTMDVDGRYMVLVVRARDGPVYVLFYKLTNNGEWQKYDVFETGGIGIKAAAAISGNAAFVGFADAYDNVGTVIVFHRNRAGKWERMNEPFTMYSPAAWGFGYGVAIDGDLAVVATDNLSDNKILVFRRESEKWVQFDIFNGRCPCSISGDVIISWKTDDIWKVFVQVYKYTAETGTFTPFQDSFPVGEVKQLDSSHDYFIYWDAAASWIGGPTLDEKTSNTFMFRREDGNQTFTFFQQFNISGKNDALSIDNDILILAGHVFSLQNGIWVETFMLDRQFDEYKLSGRRLLARSKDEVVSFRIDNCTHEMPTQIPLLSVSPSDAQSTSTPTTRPSSSVVPSLSSSPTANPSISLAPTLSSSPTDTCYLVLIFIDYDNFSSEVSWKLFRKDDSNGGEELIESFATINKIPLYNDSICLHEGQYEFIIFDSAHDGICCKYEETPFYSLSLENGILIRKGGEFGYSESTEFSIPYLP